MPADFFAQGADDQRRGDDARVDTEVENLKCVGAAEVGGLVKCADLAGDIAFEQTDADDERRKREEQQCFACHQEVPERHRHRAEQDCQPSPKPAIGDEAARDRRQIDEREIPADDRAGERLSLDPAEKGADEVEADDARDPFGREQIFGQVQREQRLHAVIAEPLPRLGKCEIPEAGRMPEDVARRGGVGGRSGFGSGHIISVRAEPIEALSFNRRLIEKGQPFDKLRANGVLRLSRRSPLRTRALALALHQIRGVSRRCHREYHVRFWR